MGTFLGASALPGVSAVSVTNILPLSGRLAATEAVAEDSTTRAQAAFSSIAPNFFAAMRIDLRRGRDFNAGDVAGAAPVVIVNETLARRLWPDGDALGKRLRADARGEVWRDVVGIVRDGKYGTLTEPPRGAFYIPLAQHPQSPLMLIARTATDPGTLIRGLTDAAQRIDPDMPLYRVQTLEFSIHQLLDKQRSVASLLGVFGAITLLLAAIGIYGVAAHTVSLRTREIGIRMSLGARAADVLRMFVGEMLSLAMIGVIVGLAIAGAVSRLLTTSLFGLRPTDAMTFAAATAILYLAAVMASYVPARAAARVDPLEALKHD